MVSIKSGPPHAGAGPGRVAAGRPQRSGRLRRWLGNAMVQRILSLVVVLGAWQLIGAHFPYSMSSPGAIVRGARSSLVSQVLPAFGQTLASFGLGFAISILVGVPVGLAMARVRVVRIALEPYVLMLYSMPMLALIPVLIIIFGVSFPLRVAGVVLFGIFAIIVNTFTGAARIDPALEDVGTVLRRRAMEADDAIIFPGSLRYIFAGIRIGFGHGMIGAVVIEIEASAVGMGSLLTTFIQELRLGQFFVVVIVLGIFSIVCSVADPRRRALVHRALAARAPLRPPPGRRRAVRTPAGRPAVHRRAARPRRARGVRPRSAARGSRRTRAEPPLNRWLRTAAGPGSVRTVGAGATSSVTGSGPRSSISRAVLPSPVSVAKAAYQLIFVNHQIFGPLLSSLELLFAGFALAVALGIPLGLAMGRFRWFENVTDPYVSFLYALPHVVLRAADGGVAGLRLQLRPGLRHAVGRSSR